MSKIGTFTGNTLNEAMEQVHDSGMTPLTLEELMTRQIQVLEAVRKDPTLFQNERWNAMAREILFTDVYTASGALHVPGDDAYSVMLRHSPELEHAYLHDDINGGIHVDPNDVNEIRGVHWAFSDDENHRSADVIAELVGSSGVLNLYNKILAGLGHEGFGGVTTNVPEYDGPIILPARFKWSDGFIRDGSFTGKPSVILGTHRSISDAYDIQAGEQSSPNLERAVEEATKVNGRSFHVIGGNEELIGYLRDVAKTFPGHTVDSNVERAYEIQKPEAQDIEEPRQEVELEFPAYVRDSERQGPINYQGSKKIRPRQVFIETRANDDKRAKRHTDYTGVEEIVTEPTSAYDPTRTDPSGTPAFEGKPTPSIPVVASVPGQRSTANGLADTVEGPALGPDGSWSDPHVETAHALQSPPELQVSMALADTALAAPSYPDLGAPITGHEATDAMGVQAMTSEPEALLAAGPNVTLWDRGRNGDRDAYIANVGGHISILRGDSQLSHLERVLSRVNSALNQTPSVARTYIYDMIKPDSTVDLKDHDPAFRKLYNALGPLANDDTKAPYNRPKAVERIGELVDTLVSDERIANLGESLETAKRLVDVGNYVYAKDLLGYLLAQHSDLGDDGVMKKTISWLDELIEYDKEARDADPSWDEKRYGSKDEYIAGVQSTVKELITDENLRCLSGIFTGILEQLDSGNMDIALQRAKLTLIRPRYNRENDARGTDLQDLCDRFGPLVGEEYVPPSQQVQHEMPAFRPTANGDPTGLFDSFEVGAGDGGNTTKINGVDLGATTTSMSPQRVALADRYSGGSYSGRVWKTLGVVTLLGIAAALGIVGKKNNYSRKTQIGEITDYEIQSQRDNVNPVEACNQIDGKKGIENPDRKTAKVYTTTGGLAYRVLCNDEGALLAEYDCPGDEERILQSREEYDGDMRTGTTVNWDCDNNEDEPTEVKMYEDGKRVYSAEEAETMTMRLVGESNAICENMDPKESYQSWADGSLRKHVICNDDRKPTKAGIQCDKTREGINVNIEFTNGILNRPVAVYECDASTELVEIKLN